jgi:hypothetical protein
MSVIFETLQKLNRPAVAADAEKAAARPRRNTYALKSVLLSPVTVLLLAVVVFGLGYGLVFGLHYLQRQARLDPSVMAAAKVPEPQTAPPKTAAPEMAAPEMADPQAVQEVPPPPDLRQLEGATETAAAADTAAAATPPATAEATFAGPDVPPPPAAQMAALPDEAATFSPAGTWTSPATPEDSAFAVASVSGRPTTPLSEAEGMALSARPRFRGGAQPTISPSQSFGEASLERAPDAPGATAAALANTRANTVATTAADISQQPLPPTAATLPPTIDDAGETRRPAKRTPIPRYTELVYRLQTALTRGDGQAADRLLGDFAAVKGKNHPYFLKLKAYRYLQAGEFAAAERLLGQVLAQDQTDRDANINMVVVEANTGRIDAARRRLAGLEEQFPEDETLAAMGRRLN